MRKRALSVVLTWTVVAVTALVLYLLRESSPVKEFIAWALSVWPILATLCAIALAISGWIIKHDFGPKASTKIPAPVLCEIPRTIYQIHGRLTSLVVRRSKQATIDVKILARDYLELLGMDELNYPELKRITPTSDVKTDREVLGTVLDKLLLKFVEVDDIKSLLIRIGGLMNVKGVGISQIRDADNKYARLNGRLAKLRPEIPTELNAAIDNYLQFSFGYNSLYLLMLSMPCREMTNVLPSKYSAELGVMKQRMDTAMNELLAEVTSIIQELNARQLVRR